MIFAAETDEHSLHVFPDADTAAAYCDALDVENTVWRFWDDDGSPLEPRFTVPNQRRLFTTTLGEYVLVPGTDEQHESLLDVLPHIRMVVGELPFTDVKAVSDHLLRNKRSPDHAVAGEHVRP